MSERALPAPPVTPESAPFFAAAAEGRFAIGRCTSCQKPHWYPRAVCPFCGGAATLADASGRGVLYSFSVMRRAAPPYAIAYVTLDEGPAMMTNLVDCDLDALRIGQRVRVAFRPAEGGAMVPCFRPDDTA